MDIERREEAEVTLRIHTWGGRKWDSRKVVTSGAPLIYLCTHSAHILSPFPICD